MNTFPTPYPELRQPDAIEKARQMLGSGKLPIFKSKLLELKPVRDEPIESGVAQTIPVYREADIDNLIQTLAASPS
jgi:hypothetical protein